MYIDIDTDRVLEQVELIRLLYSFQRLYHMLCSCLMIMEFTDCLSAFEDFLRTKETFKCSCEEMESFLQTLSTDEKVRDLVKKTIMNTPSPTFKVHGQTVSLSSCYMDSIKQMQDVLQEDKTGKLSHIMQQIRKSLGHTQRKTIGEISTMLEISGEERVSVRVCEQRQHLCEAKVKMHHYLLLEGLQDVVACLLENENNSVEDVWKSCKTSSAPLAMQKVGMNQSKFEKTLKSYPEAFRVEDGKVFLNDSPGITYSLILSHMQSAKEKLKDYLLNQGPLLKKELFRSTSQLLSRAEVLAMGGGLEAFTFTLLSLHNDFLLIPPYMLVIAQGTSQVQDNPFVSAVAKIKDFIRSEGVGNGSFISQLLTFVNKTLDPCEQAAVGNTSSKIRETVGAYPGHFGIDHDTVFIKSDAAILPEGKNLGIQSIHITNVNQRIITDNPSSDQSTEYSVDSAYSDALDDTVSPRTDNDIGSSVHTSSLGQDEVESLGSESISDSESLHSGSTGEDENLDPDTALLDQETVTILQDRNYFGGLITEFLDKATFPILSVSLSDGWLIVGLWDGHTFATCFAPSWCGHQKMQGQSEESALDFLTNKSILKVVFGEKVLHEINDALGIKMVNVFDLKMAHNLIRPELKEAQTLHEALSLIGVDPYATVEVCNGTIQAPVSGEAYSEEAIIKLKETARWTMKQVPCLYQKILGMMTSYQITKISRLHAEVEDQPITSSCKEEPSCSLITSSKTCSEKPISGTLSKTSSEEHVSITSTSSKTSSEKPVSGASLKTSSEEHVSVTSSETISEDPISGKSSKTSSEEHVSGTSSKSSSENPDSASSSKSSSEKPVSGTSSKSSSEKPVSDKSSKISSEKPVSVTSSKSSSEKVFSGTSSKSSSEKPVSDKSSKASSENPDFVTSSKTSSEELVSGTPSKTSSEENVSVSSSNTSSEKPVSDTSSKTCSEKPISGTLSKTSSEEHVSITSTSSKTSPEEHVSITSTSTKASSEKPVSGASLKTSSEEHVSVPSSETISEDPVSGTSSKTSSEEHVPGTSSKSSSENPNSASSSKSSSEKPVSGISSKSSFEKLVSGTSSKSSSEKPVSDKSSKTSSEKPVSGTSSKSSSENLVSSSSSKSSSEKPVSDKSSKASSEELVSGTPSKTSSEENVSVTSSNTSSEKPVSDTSSKTSSDKSVFGTSSNTSSEEPVSGTSSKTSSEKPVSGKSSKTSSEKPVAGKSSKTSSEKPVSGKSSKTSSEKPVSGTSSNTSSGKPDSGTSPNTSSEKPVSGKSSKTSSEKPVSGTSSKTSSGKPDSGTSSKTSSEKPVSGKASKTSSEKPVCGTSLKTSSGKPDSGKSSKTSSGKPDSGKSSKTSSGKPVSVTSSKTSSGKPVSGTLSTLAKASSEQPVSVHRVSSTSGDVDHRDSSGQALFNNDPFELEENLQPALLSSSEVDLISKNGGSSTISRRKSKQAMTSKKPDKSSQQVTEGSGSTTSDTASEQGTSEHDYAMVNAKVLHYDDDAGKPTLISFASKLANKAINPCQISHELSKEFGEIVMHDQDKFLEAFGICIKYNLKKLSEEHKSLALDQLTEVVMDVGRKPSARYYQPEHPDQLKVKTIGDNPLTKQDLKDFMEGHCSPVSSDHRSSIKGTLHRVGIMCNRQNEPIGLTALTKHAVLGCATPLFDLMNQGQSILFVGNPGVGKSTILREAGRVINDVVMRRAVIVDTCNEIAGDGDIPHPSVGGARRVQLLDRDSQPSMTREVIRNHSPQTLIIDEVVTEADATAALATRQRGIQVISTAPGQTLQDVILNPNLAHISGGIQNMAMNPSSGSHRGNAGHALMQRTQPAAFDILVEMHDRYRWIVHTDFTRSIDMCLQKEAVSVQERRLVMKEVSKEPEGIPQVMVQDLVVLYPL